MRLMLSLICAAYLGACGKSSKEKKTESADAVASDFFLTEGDFRPGALGELSEYEVESEARDEDIFSSSALSEKEDITESESDSTSEETQNCFLAALEKSTVKSPEPQTVFVSLSSDFASCFPSDSGVEKFSVRTYLALQCPEADFSPLNGMTLREVTESNSLEAYDFSKLCTRLSSARHSSVNTTLSLKGDDESVIKIIQQGKSFKGGATLRSMCDETITPETISLSDDCRSLDLNRLTDVYVNGTKREIPASSDFSEFRTQGFSLVKDEYAFNGWRRAGGFTGSVNGWKVSVTYNESGYPDVQISQGSQPSSFHSTKKFSEKQDLKQSRSLKNMMYNELKITLERTHLGSKNALQYSR